MRQAVQFDAMDMVEGLRAREGRMKKHQCVRCKRHVAGTRNVKRRCGTLKTLCAKCIETLKAKGAVVDG